MLRNGRFRDIIGAGNHREDFLQLTSRVIKFSWAWNSGAKSPPSHFLPHLLVCIHEVGVVLFCNTQRVRVEQQEMDREVRCMAVVLTK